MCVRSKQRSRNNESDIKNLVFRMRTKTKLVTSDCVDQKWKLTLTKQIITTTCRIMEKTVVRGFHGNAVVLFCIMCSCVVGNLC